MAELSALTDVDALPVGGVRLVKAGGKRLAVVRTSEGIFALDNACPHEGYGLVQGEVVEGTLTCHWHNWKFRLADGACVFGEEDVRSYPVRVEDGRVLADLSDPDPAESRPRLLQSLRRGIERDEAGRIARDVVRLLRASADPGELVWEAIAWGAPRAEFGWGHAVASAVDCLDLLEHYEGDARALPVVQAIAGISEGATRWPRRPQPPPAAALPADPRTSFRALVEAERVDDAEALVLAAVEAGIDAGELSRWFVEAVSDHHLGYGHMAIYTQKAFTLLDRLGWDRAPSLLPHLVPTLVYGTREDKLPYMRPFLRALHGVDWHRVATAGAAPDPSWQDDGTLRAALLGADKHAPAGVAVRAVLDGAGVDGLLDAVVLAVSERLLRYDPTTDFDHRADFGWLDMTHGITYAHAARWAWHRHPGPDTARLALFCAFLAHYTGRAEWRRARGGEEVRTPEVEARTGDLQAAVEDQRPDEAAAFALGLPARDASAQLERAALSDRASSAIVAFHFVKTARAAAQEAVGTGSSLPLAAAARFMSAPRLERFVTSSVGAAIDLLSGRGPADRDEETSPG